MKIEADATISFPRDLCFSTYRDRLAELVPYLPNVRAIEVKETETQADGKVRKLNVWHAKADIPGPAQAFLKPEMLKWDDHATWDGSAFTCDWRVATHFFKDRVKCQGRNTFLVVDGQKTKFSLRGELDINLKGLPGVPSLIAGPVSGVIEKFVIALLTPNLMSVSKGLEAFLRDAEKRGEHKKV